MKTKQEILEQIHHFFSQLNVENRPKMQFSKEAKEAYPQLAQFGSMQITDDQILGMIAGLAWVLDQDAPWK